MNMESIIQLINGVGFPIVVSIALFYQNNKQDERYQELTRDLQEVLPERLGGGNERTVRSGRGDHSRNPSRQRK